MWRIFWFALRCALKHFALSRSILCCCCLWGNRNNNGIEKFMGIHSFSQSVASQLYKSWGTYKCNILYLNVPYYSFVVLWCRFCFLKRVYCLKCNVDSTFHIVQVLLALAEFPAFIKILLHTAHGNGNVRLKTYVVWREVFILLKWDCTNINIKALPNF